MSEAAHEGPTLRAGDSIRDAMLSLERSGLGSVVIVDDQRRVVGAVSDADLRRAILQHHRLDDPLTGVMRTDLASGEGASRREAVAPLRVVILAGGQGLQLRPLTETIPKPMLRVGERPVLETVVRELVRAGLTRITIAVHYLGHAIADHFGDGSAFGAEIDYLYEKEPLGTAGAVAVAAQAGEGPILAMNGDILTTLNFLELIADHRRRANAMTMALVPVDMTIPYGVCTLEGHRIVSIVEKPRTRYFANAGIYVLEHAALQFISPGERYDMPALANRCIENGLAVGGFPVLEFWRDIGRPADFEAAHDDFERHFGDSELPGAEDTGLAHDRTRLRSAETFRD